MQKNVPHKIPAEKNPDITTRGVSQTNLKWLDFFHISFYMYYIVFFVHS